MLFENHPTPDEFEFFLRGNSRQAETGRNSRVVRHLLADCKACRESLIAIGWGGERLDRLFHLPWSGASPVEFAAVPAAAKAISYDGAFAAANQAVADFLASDRSEETAPQQLLAELSSLALAEQIRAVEQDDRFARAQFVRFLIDQSHAARYEDPEKMLYLADLARRAAEACAPEATGSEARLADLRSRAWGHFGNSLRVRGQISEAEQALATAESYCKAGTGDPLLRARLLEQRASLCYFQRHFEQAMELADEAGAIYREIGDTHRLASSLVHKAIACLYGGDAEQAVRILNGAIPMIDQEDDPHLLLAACHNLIRCYIDLDKPEQALSLYFKSRDLYKEFKDTLILMRASWQEGQLLRELGHLHAAETSLLRARKGFLQRGLAYEVALVSLDISTVYIKLSDAEKLRQTISETMPIFRSLRVGREVLATLLQLQQVADQEHQALALIHLVSERIEKISHRHLLK
jgi:tetratricopeptide (TPR) repeat protein